MFRNLDIHCVKGGKKILSIFPPKTLAQYVLPLIVLLASKRANTTFIYFKDLVLLATLFSKSVHTLKLWNVGKSAMDKPITWRLVSCLFDFPFIYQFYFTMNTLVKPTCWNPDDLFIFKSFHQHFKTKCYIKEKCSICSYLFCGIVKCYLKW